MYLLNNSLSHTTRLGRHLTIRLDAVLDDHIVGLWVTGIKGSWTAGIATPTVISDWAQFTW